MAGVWILAVSCERYTYIHPDDETFPLQLIHAGRSNLYIIDTSGN